MLVNLDVTTGIAVHKKNAYKECMRPNCMLKMAPLELLFYGQKNVCLNPNLMDINAGVYQVVY